MTLKQIGFLLLSLWLASLAHASALSDKLHAPDHVLLMRHTLAPGVGDPAGYVLSDCKTQRNLSNEGRRQAEVVGQWLKKQGVVSADVYASAWCRCKDTAERLNFHGYRVEPTLASFFDEMHKAPAQTQALQQFIAEKRKASSKPLILVTHHVNIHAFMGENINSGDMVLAQVDAQGKMVAYTVIPRPN